MLLPLAQRQMEAEDIDNMALDPAAHQEAMRGLARVNGYSRATEVLWRHVRAVADHRGTKNLRVLDIATGAGDMPVGMWELARRQGYALDIDASDRHPGALEVAAATARQAGLTLKLRTLDVLKEDLPTGYDLVTTSLFLHHLTEDQVVDVLRRMGRAAPAIVVMDLSRGLWGMMIARFGTPMLTPSRVLHRDAVESFRAAFTVGEARKLAAKAGLGGARVRRVRGARWVLTWER